MIKKNKQGTYDLVASFQTAPNIGLIKYWGKWHQEEIIPLNDNIGFTLSQEDLSTTTKLLLTTKINKNILLINKQEYPITKRIERILQRLSEEFQVLGQRPISSFKNNLDENLQNNPISTLVDVSKLKFYIKSLNSFPTASGLASSSSGLSALSLCINEIFQSEKFPVGYLSRICSGSSIRCLQGNLNIWHGVSVENIDKVNHQEVVDYESKRCIAKEIPNSNWFAECTYVLILMDQMQGQKEVGSTDGMQQTAMTSQFLQFRIRDWVPGLIKVLLKQIAEKDFNGIINTMIKDSNSFHAVCLDTTPPLFYLNEFSKQIIGLVHKFNLGSDLHVGYTFDAGAHAVLIIHKDVIKPFLGYLNQYCNEYDLLQDNFEKIKSNERFKQFQAQGNQNPIHQYIQPSEVLLTRIGQGPIKLL